MKYREFAHWSLALDCPAVRLSVWDERGGEYWMLLPRRPGDKWRKAREEALESIAEAIEQGCEPGEVRVMA